jgi:isoprenylcysteine carboxyl methyltransferase (ICMT) family protein YpbQ
MRLRAGDLAGIAFFTFALALSILAGIEHPSVLGALSVIHNGMLVFIFLVRRQPVKTDRTGLYLGLIASILPSTTFPESVPIPLLVLGLIGYALVLWSLAVLWKSFGIAPADRGLVTIAPYNLVRHPMYLGELLLRAAIVMSAGELWGYGMFLVLVMIQILRIKREETIIAGYEEYSKITRWRLLPGVW